MAMVGGARSAVAVAVAARCWRFRSKKAAAPVFLRPFSGAPNGRLLPICQGFRTRVKAPIIKSRRETGFGQRASNLDSRSIASEVQETITGAGVVNESTFKKLVLESDIPVLVDFWAPWCGPCRMIAPLIDEMARQYAGKLRCLKINTDECPQIATDYGIRSIPTVMVFVGGEKKETVIGAVPKSTLTATVEKYLEW